MKPQTIANLGKEIAAELETQLDQRTALNLPYETPKTVWEYFTRGVDPYKANYDKVFGK